MKNYIVIIFVSFLCINTSFAQETGKLRIGLETGVAVCVSGEIIPIPNVLSMELKYNIHNNMNIGFKTEATDMVLNKSTHSQLLTFLATYDYYFHYKNSIFSPFTGAGLGYYFGQVYGFKGDIQSKFNNPTCFVRTGVEFWKIRASFAYNLVRKPRKYYNRNLDYVSLAVGFYIGGGKWNVE
jgi:hypothetical protein